MGLMPSRVSHSWKAAAMTSGPLSERMYSGTKAKKTKVAHADPYEAVPRQTIVE